ncbi:Tox-REase-5 domain-containing protein [Burkholderia vietnamiensis]|uniref:Tox-REase-5 domain-containing protein n=1 Tax=Burkholderia vietnamiensis TaxID=60552 RepID=UPI0026530346|nr:Tox-REase-5 domain-containing protein [Burkholderia vietnamiensis]MDN7665634.1 Tox-REase-5 domain-containing protein [Burkholderia vietnamiensis]
MGIPFPPVLSSAANMMAQAIPMPVPIPAPTPAPSAGPAGGTGAGADGGWGALPRDRSREREQPCKCPPEKGGMAPVNHSMSELSAEYQEYITHFPRGLEWQFSNKDFDGFDKKACLLQEAKANYDFFFDKNGRPNFMFLRGKGAKNTGEAKSIPAKDSIIKQASDQSAIVIENPPSKLRWYFMQNKFYRWATAEFSGMGLPITTEYKEMPINGGSLK